MHFSTRESGVKDKLHSWWSCTDVIPWNEVHLQQLICANQQVRTRKLCIELNISFSWKQWSQCWNTAKFAPGMDHEYSHRSRKNTLILSGPVVPIQGWRWQLPGSHYYQWWGIMSPLWARVEMAVIIGDMNSRLKKNFKMQLSADKVMCKITPNEVSWNLFSKNGNEQHNLSVPWIQTFMSNERESLWDWKWERLPFKVFGFCSFHISAKCEWMGVQYTETRITLEDSTDVNINNISDSISLKDSPKNKNP